MPLKRIPQIPVLPELSLLPAGTKKVTVSAPETKPWGAKEFAIGDRDRNLITFVGRCESNTSCED